METIGILGAGAWGTALAVAASRPRRRVLLWAHEEDVVEAIATRSENPLYLPGVPLGPEIRATHVVAEACAADLVLVAVPTAHLRRVTTAAGASWRRGTAAVICSKGIERGTAALMTEVVAETIPSAPAAVLSGPSFAAEVARHRPTALTLAAHDAALRTRILGALATPVFRIYESDDPIGAQLGGAIKNVLAIACGIVDGRGLGSNARAALIARGLAEMMRLAAALGGRAQTLMGLSGLGDLVLTCTSARSRNYALGVALGEGRALSEVLADRRTVAEGVFTAESVAALARARGIEMPICAAVDAVLNRAADIDGTIAGLLARPPAIEGPLAP